MPRPSTDFQTYDITPALLKMLLEVESDGRRVIEKLEHAVSSRVQKVLQRALMGNDLVRVTQEEFGFDMHLGNDVLVSNEVGLDELSQCIRAGQEKGTLDRWMDCINSLGSHATLDSHHLLLSPKAQLSFMEENGAEVSILKDQGEKEKVEEEFDTLEASGCVSGMQIFSTKFLHSSAEGENIMSDIAGLDPVQADERVTPQHFLYQRRLLFVC